MSVFPNDYDTDQEIPRVDSGVTEIDGTVVNSLRDAIFSIERSIGINPQGNKPSLADRISVSIDNSGNLKRSALDLVGLATLPITDAQVATAAAIKESKLDLNYSTITLNNAVSSVRSDVSSLQTTLSSLSSSYNSHILGISNFHDGYDVKIDKTGLTGVGGLVATTVGDAINEIAYILFGENPHIDLTLPTGIKHQAEYISVDTTNFLAIDQTVSNVQEALDNIDGEVLGQQATHVDGFHSNGIFREINSGELYNSNQPLLESGVGTYSAGTSIIAIDGVTSFYDLDVKPGDILYIDDAYGDAGTYKIEMIGPKTDSETLGAVPSLAINELSVFHTFTETETGAAISIYRPASVSSEDAPLACAIRNSETLIDTVSILNPDAARVVSLGFNGSIIGSDGYEINVEVGLGNGHVRGLTIPNLHLERLGSNAASPVSAESVAERINAYVSDPTLGYHFPITAFNIGDEIAIAHNLVGSDYTIKVLDGYTANFAMGFDSHGSNIAGKLHVGNTNNTFNVNGTSRSSLATLVNGYATITSTTETFALYQSGGSLVNPVNLGIRAGAVLHVTGHPTLDVNGSYTIESVTTSDISLFAAEQIPLVGVSTTFNVKITDSNISLQLLFDSGESDHGLVELYVDESGSILAYERVTYLDDLGPDVDIVDISSNFPDGYATISQTESSGIISFTLIEDGSTGTTVTVDNDFLGTFKLYHPNNISYLTLRINSTLSGDLETDIAVNSPLNDDEAMKICTVHFNGADTVSNVIDHRSFGNLDYDQISDNFIKVFGQQPVKDLRSNGVVRGFDLLDMPQNDSLSGMQALPLSGGIAYVNGSRVIVETQKAIIQSFDFAGNVVGNVTKVVGINESGSIRSFDDELGELLEDAYSSSVTFGKILPLYVVDLNSSGEIDTVTDVRLFINNIDAKIDLIVDESNNVVGSFRSLEGALRYADSYPRSEKPTIKIINEVRPSSSITVPYGISIIGPAQYGGRHAKIVNDSVLNDSFIKLSGANKIKNIEIESEEIAMDGYLISVNGPYTSVEDCSIKFSGGTPSIYENDYGIGLSALATEDVSIVGNKINNVFGGIVADEGCNRLLIENNTISNVLGESAETYAIRAGDFTNSVSIVTIRNNNINIPSPVGGSLITGIMYSVVQDSDVVRIENNNIIHENQDTMYYGIKVDNEFGTSGVIKSLILGGNYVDGVAYDSNSVYGIYVNYCSYANISLNTLKNIGYINNTNTIDAGIKIGSSTKHIKISNNTLEDGYVLSGIEVTSGTPHITIDNNTIKNVGHKDLNANQAAATSSVGIRCNTPDTFITNNKFIGLGQYGVYVQAAASGTKISGNMMCGDDSNVTAAGVSFLAYGMRILASNVTVHDNDIVDMIASDSVGIKVESSSTGCKISENTIHGSSMTQPIQVDAGSLHMISNNYLKNENGTNMILLENSVSDSFITGNIMEGSSTYGIQDSGTASDISITNNDMSNVTFGTRALQFASSTGCMFAGNTVPANDTSATTIGSGNIIGINKNLSDSFCVPSIASTTSNWALGSSGLYIYVNSTSATATLPLSEMPTGSTISSVTIYGARNNSLPSNYSFELFKVNHSTQVSTSLGTASDNSSDGNFSATISSINDAVDQSTYRYILVAGATGSADDGNRLYSIVVNIVY